jgi:glycosyltransferase involved in cell wall biosynthesis
MKRDNVLITGSLTRAETLNKLKNADIFVLTSNYEGFPITILEAMSFGLPVIASDVGGVSEIVDNSVGYLIKRGDKEGLKRALKELIDSKAIRLEKGNNARKRIEESFTLDKMLSKTEQVYLQ